MYSEQTVAELRDVLTRPRMILSYGISDATVEAVVAAVAASGEAVVPDRRVLECRDPKDDKFLEVAVAGNADVIVSGDEDLLVLSPFEGVPIVGPAAFLAMLEQGPPHR